MDNGYWSVEDCGWKGALVTPWSARGVDIWSWPAPSCAAEVLRVASAEDPAQPPVVVPAQPEPADNLSGV